MPVAVRQVLVDHADSLGEAQQPGSDVRILIETDTTSVYVSGVGAFGGADAQRDRKMSLSMTWRALGVLALLALPTAKRGQGSA